MRLPRVRLSLVNRPLVSLWLASLSLVSLPLVSLPLVSPPLTRRRLAIAEAGLAPPQPSSLLKKQMRTAPRLELRLELAR